MRWLVLTVLIAALAGCSGGGSSPEATLDAEIRAVFEGDADLLAALMHDPWIDFGGCIEIPRAEVLENLKEWFESDDHAQEMAPYTSHRELVDWSTMERFDPTTEGFFDCEHYTPQAGDVGLWVSGSDESPLFDGWGGIYRQVGGRWVNIGGD